MKDWLLKLIISSVFVNCIAIEIYVLLYSDLHYIDICIYACVLGIDDQDLISAGIKPIQVRVVQGAFAKLRSLFSRRPILFVNELKRV